jgi:hypothetical protein
MAKKKINYALGRRAVRACSEKITIHESPDSFFARLEEAQRKKKGKVIWANI